jgi:Domain of unknown function (DUF4288)
MGYIPKDAKWYLARLVQEITVEGDPRNVVHTNLVLIRADSPEEAYQKALELGAQGEIAYENPQGLKVKITFRGLNDLGVIHDPLEHGAELEYTEHVDMDEATLKRWISSKEDLSVFAPIEPSGGPNYGSREVIEKLHRFRQ